MYHYWIMAYLLFGLAYVIFTFDEEFMVTFRKLRRVLRGMLSATTTRGLAIVAVMLTGLSLFFLALFLVWPLTIVGAWFLKDNPEQEEKLNQYDRFIGRDD